MKPPQILRNIPSVTELLESPALKGLVDRISHNVVVDGVRSFLDDFRSDIQSRANELSLPPVHELAERIARKIMQTEKPTLHPVVNATGILLHTGLGRAPLAEEAVAAMGACARDYASVEMDLVDGQRSRRTDVVADVLKKLTGAESSMVVNNNAAATLLALCALAQGKEVIVSRGQLIEIGGSYRLPDVMEASGAILREVGTTNKTRISDYKNAVGENTAGLLRVHSSNFRIVGFTAEVPLLDLVSIGRQYRLPVIDDIGSGALVDFQRFGCDGEPVAKSSISDGADLVLFSGDKLLGGPQCGIAVGRADLVKQMMDHPLARAVRVDKITLAALAATLSLYRDENKAVRTVPLLQLLDTPLENLKKRAERLAPQMELENSVAQAQPLEDRTFLGGGSVPHQEIATWCIAITPAEKGPHELAQSLRLGNPPVVGRVQRDLLMLDLRSVFPRQDQDLVTAIKCVGKEAASQDLEFESEGGRLG